VALVSLAPAEAQLFNNGRPERPSVTLPDGPVRSVILHSCTQCHGIDEYGYYAMDRDAWLALIERMKVTPSGVVAGAVISDADREILLDWLVAEFGPDSTPFERQYIPRELGETDLLSDTQARERIASSCSTCHGVDVVFDARRDESGWRRIVTREMGRGAALLIDEADPLIEWLARTLGPVGAN
jgi:cytochrome c553